MVLANFTKKYIQLTEKWNSLKLTVNNNNNFSHCTVVCYNCHSTCDASICFMYFWWSVLLRGWSTQYINFTWFCTMNMLISLQQINIFTIFISTSRYVVFKWTSWVITWNV